MSGLFGLQPVALTVSRDQYGQRPIEYNSVTVIEEITGSTESSSDPIYVRQEYRNVLKAISEELHRAQLNSDEFSSIYLSIWARIAPLSLSVTSLLVSSS